jgi:hypothetical protein
MSDWSLTTLKEKLIKIGAKVVSHGRYIVFQMAEVAIAADVPGDFATYRGTAAAAAVGTGMRDPIFMHQRQPTGGVRPNATQNGQTDPRTPCRSLLCRKSPLSRAGTSRQSRKSLQFAPLPSSSGESRIRLQRGPFPELGS